MLFFHVHDENRVAYPLIMQNIEYFEGANDASAALRMDWLTSPSLAVFSAISIGLTTFPSLAGVPLLQTLTLSRNRITTVAADAILHTPHLTSVIMDGNPSTCILVALSAPPTLRCVCADLYANVPSCGGRCPFMAAQGISTFSCAHPANAAALGEHCTPVCRAGFLATYGAGASYTCDELDGQLVWRAPTAPAARVPVTVMCLPQACGHCTCSGNNTILDCSGRAFEAGLLAEIPETISIFNMTNTNADELPPYAVRCHGFGH